MAIPEIFRIQNPNGIEMYIEGKKGYIKSIGNNAIK